MELKKDVQYCVEKNTEFLDVDKKKILEFWNTGKSLRADCLFSINNGNLEFDTTRLPKVTNSNLLRRSGFYKKVFSELAKDNPHWDFTFLVNVEDNIGRGIKAEFNGYITPRLLVTRRRDCPNFITIPYFFDDFFKDITNLSKKDIPFDKKIKKINFVGAATGAPEDKDNNQRINFCKMMDNNEHVHARIHYMKSYKKRTKSIPHLLVNDRVLIKEQLKYRYLLNINGNVTCWGRLPWQMYSNSVCMYLKPREDYVDWYYCLFEREGTPLPFVWVTEENIIEIKKEFDEDDDFCLKHIAYGKDFVKKYLTKEFIYSYLTGVFEKINNLSK